MSAGTRFGSVCFAALLAACGGGGESGKGIDGGGGGGEGDCPGGDGAPEFATESFFWDGENLVCGTATLPEERMTGRRIQLLLHRIDDPGNEFLADSVTTNSEDRVHYRISLQAGEYRIGLRIDDTGDQTIGSGDLQGFFDGTTQAPILEAADAPVITLDGSRNHVDFGLGRLP